MSNLDVAQPMTCNSLFSRDVQVGRHTERSCSHCHRIMSLRFQLPLFEFHVEKRKGQSAARAGRSRAQGPGARHGEKAIPNLQRGEPLPDLGTCKHYRHSHRYGLLRLRGKRSVSAVVVATNRTCPAVALNNNAKQSVP